jgi:hypothetical protein
MVLINLARPTAAALYICICALYALLLYLHVAPRVSAEPNSELCAPRNLYISIVSPLLALAAHLPPFHYPCPYNLPYMINPARARCEFRAKVTSQHRACTSYRCTGSMSAPRQIILNPLPAFLSDARLPFQHCGLRFDTLNLCASSHCSIRNTCGLDSRCTTPFKVPVPVRIVC